MLAWLSLLLSVVRFRSLCKRFVHFVLPTFLGRPISLCVSCISHFLAAASCLVGVLVMTPPPPLLACPFATPQLSLCFPLPLTLRWKVCFEYAAIAAFELCVEQQDMS